MISPQDINILNEFSESSAENYKVMIYGIPGAGKFECCCVLVKQFFQKNFHIVYLTTLKDPMRIKEHWKREYEFDIENNENNGKFIFIDARDNIDQKYEKGLDVNPASTNQISARVTEKVKEAKEATKIFFDSLSTLFTIPVPNPEINKLIQRFHNNIKGNIKGAIFYTLDKGVCNKEVLTGLMSNVDCVLEVYKDKDGKTTRLKIIKDIFNVINIRRKIEKAIEDGTKDTVLNFNNS